MKATKTNIAGLILAGGYSQRMGRDKAMLEFHGMPQVVYAQLLLKKYCAEVFLSKRKNQQVPGSMMAIDDAPEFSNIGPLGGILSAMKQCPEKSFLALACDLPFITEKTIETLLKGRHPQRLATAFAASDSGLPEPLCAIWEAKGHASFVKLFHQGIHCPRQVLIHSDIALIGQTDPHWLDNMNTLAEYEMFNGSTRFARSPHARPITEKSS